MELEKEYTANQQFQHQKIGYQILNQCLEFDKNIFNDFPIQQQDILPGVRCTNCNSLNMQKLEYSWHCPKCNTNDDQAGAHSVNDYLLLFKPWITNGECKLFLRLESRHTTLRILKSTPQLEYIPKLKRWIKK